MKTLEKELKYRRANKILEILANANARYLMKYGVFPIVFDITSEEGILLCSGIKRDGKVARALKPYMFVKTGLEKLL